MLALFLLLTSCRIGRWCIAQAKRLWETNWSLRVYPDGGPAEWTDIGHEQMDMIYLGNLVKRVQAFSRQHPAVHGWLDGSDPLWAIPDADARATNARYIMRHLKQDGFRFRWDAVTNQREAIFGLSPAPSVDALLQRFAQTPLEMKELHLDDPVFSATPARNSPAVLGAVINVAPELLAREAPIAAMADAVFGPLESLERAAGPHRDEHLDALLLDILPFKGQVYMRDCWDREDFAFASFICRPSPSSSGRHDDNRLQLYGHGQHLINMPPVRVSGMPQNRYAVQEWPLHDKVGGKTVHILHAARGDMMRTRGHRGAVIDLAEGVYTGGYESNRPPHATVDHAQHIRQVLLLRPIGAWLVVDRVVAQKAVTMEMDIEAMLPKYEWDADAQLEVDPDAARLKMSSVGLAGCLVQQVCPYPVGISYFAEGEKDGAPRQTPPPPANLWARSGNPRFRRTVLSSRQTTVRLETPMTEHCMMTLVLPQRGSSSIVKLRDVKRGRTYEGRIVEVVDGAVTLELLNGARHERLPLSDFDAADQDIVRAWSPSQLQAAHDTTLRSFDARFEVAASNDPNFACVTVTDRAQGSTTWAYARRGKSPTGKLAALPLVCPQRLTAAAELLVVHDRGDGSLAGMVLGCYDRYVTHAASGKRVALPSADTEFTIDTATGRLWTSARIETPLPPLALDVTMPTTFSQPTRVRLARPPADTNVHFTVDGRDPKPNDPMYDISEPPFSHTSTLFKARAFRRGADGRGLRADVDVHALTPCLLASPVLSVVFRHSLTKPPAAKMSAAPEAVGGLLRGLRVRALAGSWMDLVANAQTPMIALAATPVKKCAMHPLDAASVASARAAVEQAPHQGILVEYEGLLWVHNAGVHTILAPTEWHAPWNTECGYDLHVYIDDEEWNPSTQRAMLGKWSVHLMNGAHKIRVVWVDCRTQALRSDSWRDFPARHALWKDAVPALEWDAGRPGHRETLGLGCCFHLDEEAQEAAEEM